MTGRARGSTARPTAAATHSREARALARDRPRPTAKGPGMGRGPRPTGISLWGSTEDVHLCCRKTSCERERMVLLHDESACTVI